MKTRPKENSKIQPLKCLSTVVPPIRPRTRFRVLYSLSVRRLVWLAVLLSACATDPEEREVHFPKGDPIPCERPDPRPVLAQRGPAVLSTSFRAHGPGRALESARLAGGVYLLIKHETCTRTSQTFRFHLPKGESLSRDPAAAYKRASELIDSMAPQGAAGAPLRELAAVLSLKAAKGSAAPPLGARLELGEFQEMMVTRSESSPASSYGTILLVLYRLKV